MERSRKYNWFPAADRIYAALVIGLVCKIPTACAWANNSWKIDRKKRKSQCFGTSFSFYKTNKIKNRDLK